MLVITGEYKNKLILQTAREIYLQLVLLVEKTNIQLIAIVGGVQRDHCTEIKEDTTKYTSKRTFGDLDQKLCRSLKTKLNLMKFVSHRKRKIKLKNYVKLSQSDI